MMNDKDLGHAYCNRCGYELFYGQDGDTATTDDAVILISEHDKIHIVADSEMSERRRIYGD